MLFTFSQFTLANVFFILERMNFLISGLLIALTSIVNGHLHTNEENPQWKINLRSELESKMQTMFTNFSKQYELIKNQQLKLFLDSLGTDIKNTVKIQVDNDHDHEHEDSHDHEHDHSHQESPSINVNCLRTKLDEIFNFVKSNDDNKTNFNSSRFLNSCPYFAHGMASCFSQKITHKIEYKSNFNLFFSRKDKFLKLRCCFGICISNSDNHYWHFVLFGCTVH